MSCIIIHGLLILWVVPLITVGRHRCLVYHLGSKQLTIRPNNDSIIETQVADSGEGGRSGQVVFKSTSSSPSQSSKGKTGFMDTMLEIITTRGTS